MKKENERIICAIPKGDIYHNAENNEGKRPSGQTENDLQAELSGKAASLPEAEDCSSDLIPDTVSPGRIAVPTRSAEIKESGMMSTSGRHLVPDVTSMTKYLCSNHRLIIYSYLNQCLKDGSLANRCPEEFIRGQKTQQRAVSSESARCCAR